MEATFKLRVWDEVVPHPGIGTDCFVGRCGVTATRKAPGALYCEAHGKGHPLIPATATRFWAEAEGVGKGHGWTVREAMAHLGPHLADAAAGKLA